jgi:chromosome segregation ATPase
MLTRVLLIAALTLTSAVVGVGQTQDDPSHTLQQILAELRSIHDDMRVTQTTQLLVAELDIQQSIVNRDMENVDNASAKLNDIKRIEKQMTDQLAQAEERLDSTSNLAEQSNISAEIRSHKSEITAVQAAEHDYTTTLQNMQQRLQGAQDKLEGIQAELNAAISRLKR